MLLLTVSTCMDCTLKDAPGQRRRPTSQKLRVASWYVCVRSFPTKWFRLIYVIKLFEDFLQTNLTINCKQKITQ